PGSRGITVQAGTSGGAERLWEFQPYVVPSALVGAKSVAQAVKGLIGKPAKQCTFADLEKIAADQSLKDKFHKEVENHHKLRTTSRVSTSRTGANMSSLCLYSGPVSPYQWCRFRGGWKSAKSTPSAIPIAPSWLGTGDAGLKTKKAVQALEKGLTS